VKSDYLSRYSDGQQVRFQEAYGFSPLHSVQTCSGAHPASYAMIMEGTARGVKRPECEADYSSPSSAEVKNSGAVPPLLHMSSWHSALLIKYRNNEERQLIRGYGSY
jgi:hypothetical protein